MAKILTLLVLLMTAVTGAWATDYYVVGTMTGWQKNDQYKMTLNASAATTEYQLGIALAATDQFKVIGVDGDNPWVWYPSGDNYGQNGELTADGLYTIYFRPNGDGGSDWFYNCIYVAEGAYLAETSGEWTLTQPAFDVELEVEYETALALSDETDNAATLAEWDGYEADVTLTRTLVTSGWNTFAIPFSISAANYAALQTLLTTQGGSITVKELASSSLDAGALTLTFADATQIVAGKPYLVKVSKELNLATLPAAIALLGGTNPFAGVEVSKNPVTTETTAVDFIPTLGLTEISGDPNEILFLSSGNKLLYPSALPANIKGFRAYFKLKGEAAGARSFNIDFGDGETTSIQTTNLTNDTNNQDFFDMQGRRVNGTAKKGVYIVNGKKVLLVP